ncbi:unnamed protein product, partial [Discosporangium mesarthrocarpum]
QSSSPTGGSGGASTAPQPQPQPQPKLQIQPTTLHPAYGSSHTPLNRPPPIPISSSLLHGSANGGHSGHSGHSAGTRHSTAGNRYCSTNGGHYTGGVVPTPSSLAGTWGGG